MKDHSALYSQAVMVDVIAQQHIVNELEELFTEMIVDANVEGELLFTKLGVERKLLKELQLELQSSTAFYINLDLIRARVLDMKLGATYQEIVENEKQSWLQMHQAFIRPRL
jgi:hypothetical protein